MTILEHVTQEMLRQVCFRFGWKLSDKCAGSPFVTDKGKVVYPVTQWLGKDMDLIALIGREFDENGMSLSIRFGRYANIVSLFDRNDPDKVIANVAAARDRTTYFVCDLFIKLVDAPQPEEVRMAQITKCADCPYRQRMSIMISVNGEESRHACTKNGGAIVKDIEVIPVWCPLEKFKV